MAPASSTLAALNPFVFEPIGYRKSGQPIYPIMGGDESEEAAAQAAAAAKAAADAKAATDKAAADAAAALAATGKVEGEFDFPVGKPLVEMTPAQQTEYWRHKARKHEDRVKLYGDFTPEQLADLKAKADKQDALERELMSESEKKVADAKAQAKAEADATYRPLLAKAAIESAASGRIEAEKLAAALAPLGDLAYFINDAGQVDTAKVTAWVDGIAPAKGNPPKGPTLTPHGTRGATGGTGGTASTGREMYEARFRKPKQTQS
jgi:hypothetical protein